MAYTKRELSVCKSSYYDLAIAVIKQWHKDGRPLHGKESVDTWFSCIELYRDIVNSNSSAAVKRCDICIDK